MSTEQEDDVPVKSMAAAQVAAEHQKRDCEELDAETLKENDGEQHIYCGNCRAVLLSWGGRE